MPSARHLDWLAMRISLCQMRSGEDMGSNVATAERLLTEAADGGADLAALPETFTYLGTSAGRRAAAGRAADRRVRIDRS